VTATMVGALVVCAGIVTTAAGIAAPRRSRGRLAPRRPSTEALGDPPPMSALVALLCRLESARRRERIEQMASRAGDVSADRLRLRQSLGAFIGGVLGLGWGLLRPGGFAVVVAMFAVLAGWTLPQRSLSGRADDRARLIVDGLADAVDQLVVMTRAGLGIDAGLMRLAQTVEGPLADELARVVRDIEIGVPRPDALRAMADRVDLPELHGLVRALVHSDTLGVPVAATLAAQADDMRVARRQRAEEEAMKLPVTLLAPTVLCILPALLVVVLGPAAVQLSRNLTL
jgi:tight adherence protein C